VPSAAAVRRGGENGRLMASMPQARCGRRAPPSAQVAATDLRAGGCRNGVYPVPLPSEVLCRRFTGFDMPTCSTVYLDSRRKITL